MRSIRSSGYGLRMTLLNDTVPAISAVTADERAQRLSDAGSVWNERIARDASTAQLTYKVTGRGVGSVGTEIRAGKHTFLVDEALYVGYSLGARVGWQVLQDLGDRIPRAVLGGVPDGIPLDRLDIDQVRRYATDGTPVADPVTQNYIALAERVSGNDLHALLALAEGMRDSRSIDPDPAHAPQQPVLFATGSADAVIDGSRRLADAAPQSSFFEIPGRHHFNAPGSKDFRVAALRFLQAE